MGFLKKLLFAFAILLLILIVVGFLLPSKWSVERSITISAKSTSDIHVYVEDFKEWPKWVYWTKTHDPSLEYTYEGSEKGTGAIQKWTSSQQMGAGYMKMTSSDAAQGIIFEMYMMDDPAQLMKGEIRYASMGEGGPIMVIWTDSGDAGYNIIKRYFGLFLPSMVGQQLEYGLNNLKKLVENKQ